MPPVSISIDKGFVVSFKLPSLKMDKDSYATVRNALLSLLFISVCILILGNIYERQIPKLVEEINNGAIGAILTALTTVLLLGQQTNQQVKRQNDSKVYDTQLRTYGDLIDLLQNILDDDNGTKCTIDSKEFHTLAFQLAKVRLVSRIGPLEHITEHIKNIVFDVKEDAPRVNRDNENLIDNLMEIVDVLKSELDVQKEDVSSLTYKSTVLRIKEKLRAIDKSGRPDSVQNDNTTDRIDGKIGHADTNHPHESTTWFVNIGEGVWDGMSKFGFWQAGGGERYRKATENLKVGDRLFAYSSGNGYVGTGTVTSDAPVEVLSFRTPSGRMLADDTSASQELKAWLSKEEAARRSPEEAYWARGVTWDTVVNKQDAIKFDGMFVGLQTACRIRNSEKVEALEKAFKNVGH